MSWKHKVNYVCLYLFKQFLVFVFYTAKLVAIEGVGFMIRACCLPLLHKEKTCWVKASLTCSKRPHVMRQVT